jgi:hypothetical protein
MDSIKITITRGCKEDGSGGEVADEASAVLGSMPDGSPVLDAIAGAFADAYGLHLVDGIPVSLYRNVSYRLRIYANEIVAAFAAKQAAAVASQQASAAVAHALNSVTVIESK